MFWDREKYIKWNPYFTKENCPFCKIESDDKNMLVHKTKYWHIVYNKNPYYWFKQNLLAFPIEHKIFTNELSNEELIDFRNVEIFMKNYFWDKNYFSFIRQWEWWRSVEHIHYHYLEGIILHEKEKNFKIINVS